MHLHLFLTESPKAEAAGGPSSAPTTPALDALRRIAPGTVNLLSRGQCVPAMGAGQDPLPWRWFGAPPEAATAAYTALADGLPVGNDYWIRVDPVHLAARRDDLSVHAVTRLTQEEAGEYLTTINALLRLDGLEAVNTAPHRWYLRLPQAPDLLTTALSAMQDLPMGTGLPQGRDAGTWLRRMTELQMVLHAHPVNAIRETRGDLPVNGIWPWGGGQLAAAPVKSLGAAYGEDPLLQGLARHAGREAQPLPAHFAQLPISPRALLVFDGSLNLSALESDWMEPIRQALWHGRIEACEITFAPALKTFRISRPRLLQFWRTASVDLLSLFVFGR